MNQIDLMVFRVERINDTTDRLTLRPVQDPNNPTPWGEHYIDVPTTLGTTTGVLYTATYQRVEAE